MSRSQSPLALGRRFLRARAIDRPCAKFDVAHFFRLLGVRSGSKTAKLHLNSLKTLDAMLSGKSGSVTTPEWIISTGSWRYFRSILKPRFPSKIDFHRVTEPEEKEATTAINHYAKGILIRRMCGIPVTTRSNARAALLARCMSIYPVELRSILYNFVATEADKMTMDDMVNFERLIMPDHDGSNDVLLGHISGKTTLKYDVLASNNMLFRLLSFVSKKHPALTKDSSEQ